MRVELEQLRELMRIFDAADVTELVLESGEERIVLRRGTPGQRGGAVSVEAGQGAAVDAGASAPPSAGFPFQPGAASATGAPRSQGDAGAASASRTHTVTSPMVATFYRAAAPGAPPFVSVGDRVNEGQVLCILECMKVMNHMEAEVSGRVREILAENGASVEYGQPLFVIETDR